MSIELSQGDAAPVPKQAPIPGLLSVTDFRFAVKAMPLVSLDLLVRNDAGDYLVGLRVNPPAQGFWFVPGGRIHKNERMIQGLNRLAREELGAADDAMDWRFTGHYEHFYDTDFTGDSHRSTHYVVLAYETQAKTLLNLPTSQHTQYRWLAPRAIATDPSVHAYTRAYFTEYLT